MGKPILLSLTAQTVRDGNSDRFLESLFLPQEQREILLTLYALETELAHVHHVVTEEVNGHIRYAWWQESLEMLHAGQTPRAHPLIQALAPLLQQSVLDYETLSALITLYRGAFPDLPEDRTLVNEAAEKLVRKIAPQAGEGWRQARNIIQRHRKRYGSRWNVLLHLKLMRLGVM